ncbi:MAG: VOC family protein [Chloroflexi bacterium]|nr:VOC family protein [Chloroflexota bacterium]
MLTGIDHLVIAVPDLDAAVASYRALGFTVIPGGRHTVGTHNALVPFADGAYLELIAFYEPNPAHRWWWPLQRGGGLVDFCAATDGLASDVAAWRAAGVALADPAPMTRRRPDGYEVQWVLAIPAEEQRGVVPFLIEDRTPRAERVPTGVTHPNGVQGVDTLAVAVAALDRARGWYAAALHQPGEPMERPELGARGHRFALGPHYVELLAPTSETGPVADWLRRRGPSPYAASLRTGGATRGPLDPSQTAGARLTLVGGGP